VRYPFTLAALLVKRESYPFAPISHPTSLNLTTVWGTFNPVVCTGGSRRVQRGARVCGHTGQGGLRGLSDQSIIKGSFLDESHGFLMQYGKQKSKMRPE
jgi:hypothetical protein